MIAEFLLNIIFNIVTGLFSLLPDFSWTVETSAFQYLFSFIQTVGYLLPWNTVGAIITLVIGIISIRCVIAIIIAIWELLPVA